MASKTTFEDEFTSLCELLGENSSTLSQKFGKPNDVDENEVRTFVCYEKNHSFFGYDDNHLFKLQIPIADSSGHYFETTSDYYTFNGLRIGMSKEEVLNVWGEPATQGIYVWNIGNMKIPNGNEINISIEFTEREEDDYFLSSFNADLVEKEPFDQLFLKISDCIGCNEATIIDSLGTPDKLTTTSDGTKALFYDKIDALIMIPQNLGFADRVGMPITVSKSKIKSGYFSLQGISLGDTKNEVLQKWGNPTINTEGWWEYGDRTGTTSKGRRFAIELTFKNEIITDFQAKDYKPSTKNQKSSGFCFVATACYGDYNAPEVLVLRNYRDNVLLKTNLGRTAVKVYYRISPPIARFLEKSVLLKKLIRKNLLAPIVSKIKQNQ
jgi:outer membrane protein assembly factor BamE (lipoprotein component of BamABCDE complex)